MTVPRIPQDAQAGNLAQGKLSKSIGIRIKSEQNLINWLQCYMPFSYTQINVN